MALSMDIISGKFDVSKKICSDRVSQIPGRLEHYITRYWPESLLAMP